MTGEKYDAAIIGGGIAGCCLAVQLAKKGFKTILFEKERYPVQRVCGEYISMESWAFLTRLGLDLDQINPPRINRLRMSSPSGTFFSHRLNPGGFGLSRLFLDKSLAELAAQNGAEVAEGTTIRHVHSHGEDFEIIANDGKVYEARIVCGAYGKKSRMDKALNRRFANGQANYIGVKYHVAANLPDDLIELHVFRGGYCGISKVEGDKYCLCYLADARFLKQAGDIENLEKQILTENPYLKKYFSEYRKIAPAVTISGLYFGNKSVWDKGVFNAGDAAGFIAPLTGNGMSMAMRASFILAGLLEDYFKTGDYEQLAQRYRALWNRNFRMRVGISLQLQKLMIDSPRLANFTVGFLKNVPFLIPPLARMTHGREF